MQKNRVLISPLNEQLFESYIKVGTEAYNQHYLHLWKNGDSQPYIKTSFTTTVLQSEMQDVGTELFLILFKTTPVGILKLELHAALGCYDKKQALLLDKIYLLKAYTRKGIGKEVIDFVEKRAKELHKKMLWLDTMKDGPALGFYLNRGFKIHSETRLVFPQTIVSKRPMYIMQKEL